jgi:predicted metal-dependent hydrolase
MWTDPRYTEGLRLFAEGHWFEAHEVLELLWKEQPPGADRRFLQGLIQLAVSLEHWRRGSPRSAWGQWEKAKEKLSPLPSPYGGLDLEGLLRDFRGYYAAVALEARLAGGEAAGQEGCPPVPRAPDGAVMGQGKGAPC